MSVHIKRTYKERNNTKRSQDKTENIYGARSWKYLITWRSSLCGHFCCFPHIRSCCKYLSFLQARCFHTQKHIMASKTADHLGSVERFKHGRQQKHKGKNLQKENTKACRRFASVQALSRPLPSSWPAAPGGESESAARRAKRPERSRRRPLPRLKGNLDANPNPNQVSQSHCFIS